MPALALLGVILLPTAIGYAVVACVRATRAWAERGRDRGPRPLGPPLERVATDLRRLNRQRHELRQEAPAPGRAIRFRALDAAYHDTLLAACRVLEVEPPTVTATGLAAPEDVSRAEQDLFEQGLDVGRRCLPGPGGAWARVTSAGSADTVDVDAAQGRTDPGRVRVLAVSDEVDEGLYRQPDLVRGVDLVVSCGDLPFDYLARLIDLLEVPLLFVPGNHDPDLGGIHQSRRGLVLHAGMPVDVPWPPGAMNADGRVVDVCGLRVAGLGGCLRYSQGPNQYTQRQQRWRARRLAARGRWRRRLYGSGVDLLITHAPPRGVGDADDPAHRGFDGLHPLVSALRPSVLLHGHVHPFGRTHPDGMLGSTVVCNVVGRRVLEIDPRLGLVGERGRHGS